MSDTYGSEIKLTKHPYICSDYDS